MRFEYAEPEYPRLDNIDLTICEPSPPVAGMKFPMYLPPEESSTVDTARSMSPASFTRTSSANSMPVSDLSVSKISRTLPSEETMRLFESSTNFTFSLPNESSGIFTTRLSEGSF